MQKSLLFSNQNLVILGKFSKEAKVEIIKLSDADLEKKKKFIKFGIVGGVAFFLILLFSIFLSEVFTSTKNSDNNEASAPIASTELTSQNYKTVVQQFEDAGFTNIKTTKIEDLITGWLIEDGAIEKVTIDGKEDFEDGDFFQMMCELILHITHSHLKRSNPMI